MWYGFNKDLLKMFEMLMDDVLQSGIVTSLPGRYAKVLFDLAQEQKATKKIIEDFDKLVAIIDENLELGQTLHNPTLTRQEQSSILQVLGEKLDLSPLLTTFLHTLCDNKRYDLLKEIHHLFHQFWQACQGIQKITIEYAYPLTSEQTKILKAKLEHLMGDNLTIVYRHNDQLLSGIVIRHNNEVIDLSLATQLANIASLMKGAA